MTAYQFNTALTNIGWSQRYLAQLLGCSPTVTLRWGNDEARIPPTIAQWLLTLASFHMKHPPPDDWRVR